MRFPSVKKDRLLELVGVGLIVAGVYVIMGLGAALLSGGLAVVAISLTTDE